MLSRSQQGPFGPQLPPSPCSVLRSSFMSGKLKKSRKAALGEKQWQSLEERGSAGTQPGSHPALTRWVLLASACPHVLGTPGDSAHPACCSLPGPKPTTLPVRRRRRLKGLEAGTGPCPPR